MFIFRPNLYTINLNQIAGLLQALQIGFPKEIMDNLPAGIAQHFVEMEDPKPELVVDNTNDTKTHPDFNDDLALEEKQESPATDNVVELKPAVTGDDIAELVKEAEEFSDPPK